MIFKKVYQTHSMGKEYFLKKMFGFLKKIYTTKSSHTSHNT